MNNNLLSIKIKELRKKKGLSQQQLATNSQISLRTIQRIENGETNPIGHTLTQIANVLGVSPETLNNNDLKKKNKLFIIKNKKTLQITLFFSLFLLGYSASLLIDKDISKERIITHSLIIFSLTITSLRLSYILYFRK